MRKSGKRLRHLDPHWRGRWRRSRSNLSSQPLTWKLQSSRRSGAHETSVGTSAATTKGTRGGAGREVGRFAIGTEPILGAPGCSGPRAALIRATIGTMKGLLACGLAALLTACGGTIGDFAPRTVDAGGSSESGNAGSDGSGSSSGSSSSSGGGSGSGVVQNRGGCSDSSSCTNGQTCCFTLSAASLSSSNPGKCGPACAKGQSQLCAMDSECTNPATCQPNMLGMGPHVCMAVGGSGSGCDPISCATGCCDSFNTCQAFGADTACGTGGTACTDCTQVAQTCNAGSCQ